MYARNIKNAVSSLKDIFGRITPDHILCFVRYPSGTSVLRMQSRNADDIDMFSKEALDAFRSAFDEGDFDPLSRIFKGDHFMSIKSQIYAKVGRHIKWRIAFVTC